MLWQLKKLSTNEALNEAGPLPNNWGPVFGMAGIQDRLGDLSWLGEAFNDQGWVQVEGTAATVAEASPEWIAWNNAKTLLAASDWSMLSDVPLTVSAKQLWIEYRRDLRNIRSQAQFPATITWPVKPE